MNPKKSFKKNAWDHFIDGVGIVAGLLALFFILMILSIVFSIPLGKK